MRTMQLLKRLDEVYRNREYWLGRARVTARAKMKTERLEQYTFNIGERQIDYNQKPQNMLDFFIFSKVVRVLGM